MSSTTSTTSKKKATTVVKHATAPKGMGTTRPTVPAMDAGRAALVIDTKVWEDYAAASPERTKAARAIRAALAAGDTEAWNVAWQDGAALYMTDDTEGSMGALAKALKDATEANRAVNAWRDTLVGLFLDRFPRSSSAAIRDAVVGVKFARSSPEAKKFDRAVLAVKVAREFVAAGVDVPSPAVVKKLATSEAAVSAVVSTLAAGGDPVATLPVPEAPKVTPKKATGSDVVNALVKATDTLKRMAKVDMTDAQRSECLTMVKRMEGILTSK